MKIYDVIIIGSSPQSQAVASELAKLGKKIALIALPGEPETLQMRILSALDTKNVTPPQGPALTNMDLYADACRFVGPQTVQVGSDKLSSRRFVIASGSVFPTPSLQGLDQVAFDTPLSFLQREVFPPSATIVGAGPLGVALSATLAHKKAHVSLVSRSSSILPEEDQGLSQYVHQQLSGQGVRIWTNATALQVRAGDHNKTMVVIEQNDTRHEWESEGLVLATGLLGNTKDLELEKGRIYVDGSNEVVINEESRTSRQGAWAMGPVTGANKAFALEGFQGEQIVHNIQAPFYDKKKLEPEEPFLFCVPGALPFSRVGLTEAQAIEKYKRVCPIESGDYLKVIARKNGDIIGAHAVGPQAAAIGLFFEWAIRAQVTMMDLAESRYFPPVTPSQDIHTCVQSWVKTYLS